MATRRIKLVQNPRTSKQVGYGVWIPATAVKFNRDGSASIARSSRRRNIAAGFYEEETGIFHPIRASYDYSGTRGGDRPPKRTKRKKAKSKVKRRRR